MHSMNVTWRRFRILKSIHFHKLLTAFTFILLNLPCHAQESLEESVRTLSAKQITLPNEGIVLSDKNRGAYKSIIPTEIQKLLVDQQIPLKLYGRAPANLSLTNSAEPSEDNVAIISQEIQNILERERVLITDFTLRSTSQDSPPWETKGEWSRIYLRTLDPEGAGDQLMREKFVLTKPLSVSGYAWLTFRFIGTSDDLVWIYSPLLKKDRQVISSIRSDPLFHSALAAEDIFTWSGKPGASDIRVLSRAPFALPTIHKITTALELHDGCSNMTEGQLGTSAWGLKDPKLEYTSWIASEDSFSLYNALRVELINKDPYSSYGKQILYIHAQSKLPLMKIVYDRKGQLFKVVYSSFAASTKPTAEQGLHYWLRYSVAYDVREKSAAVFTVTNGSYCSKVTERTQLKDFDPSLLGVEKSHLDTPKVSTKF